MLEAACVMLGTAEDAVFWREFARRLEQADDPDMPGYLCHQVRFETVQEDQYRRSQQLGMFKPSGKSASAAWWSEDEEGNAGRILACCFLAAMIESE